MDDLVVLCANRDEAEQVLRLIERQLATLRLRLNPEKTRIVDYGEGLEFLGQALAPRRRGPTLEQGLASFEEADRRIREALRQARAGARKMRPGAKRPQRQRRDDPDGGEQS